MTTRLDLGIAAAIICIAVAIIASPDASAINGRHLLAVALIAALILRGSTERTPK